MSTTIPIRACKKVIAALESSSTDTKLAKHLNIDLHISSHKNHPLWAVRDGQHEVVIVPADSCNKRLCVVLGYMMIKCNVKRLAISKRLSDTLGGPVSIYMRMNARSDRALRFIFDNSASFRRLAAEQMV